MSELDDLAQPEVVNTDPKAAERLRNRDKKRVQRAREKQEKMAAKSAEEAEKERERLKAIPDVEAYWSQNRAKMTAGELEAALEVDDDIRLLHDAVEALVTLGVNDAEDMEDLAVATKWVRELYPRGLAPITLATIPKFWVKDIPAQGKEADTFLRTGLLTILPDTQAVQRFIQQYLPELWKNADAKVSQPPLKFVTMTCTQCKALASRRSVPVEIAAQYEKLNKPYLCSTCLDKEEGARKTTGIDSGVAYDTVFDSYGRVKT